MQYYWFSKKIFYVWEQHLFGAAACMINHIWKVLEVLSWIGIPFLLFLEFLGLNSKINCRCISAFWTTMGAFSSSRVHIHSFICKTISITYIFWKLFLSSQCHYAFKYTNFDFLHSPPKNKLPKNSNKKFWASFLCTYVNFVKYL